jgi:tetratricopeptide (TPR) repeat protein
MRVHNTAKDMPKYFEAEEKIVQLYPKDDYWKELVSTRASQEPGYRAAASQVRLDVYRGLAGAGVKMTGDEKYAYAREALARSLYGEALSVLQGASAAGELNTPDKQKDLTLAQEKSKSEKAGLDGEEKAAPKATADNLAALGEVFMTYGDNTKAIDYLQKALAKGIADGGKADVARLHLGISQFKAGQKDAAKATWAEIKSDNGTKTLARAWTLIADKPAA